MWYGPEPTVSSRPAGSTRKPCGTEHANGSASRLIRSLLGSLKRMRSLRRPFADICLMSENKLNPGEAMSGLCTLLIANTKLAAVSGVLLLNRSPRRILKRYVRLSRETVGKPAAASGRTSSPDGALASRKAISVAQVAYQ